MTGGPNSFAYVYALLLVVSTISDSSAASPSPYDIKEAWAKAQADSLFVSCRPDRPTVLQGESVELKAWATSSEGKPIERELNYDWSVSTGSVGSNSAGPRWDLKNAKPGNHVATVRVAEGNQEWVDCSLQIVVESSKSNKAAREKIERRAFLRETGHSYLLPQQQERKGYGLYSYLLFGGPPNNNSRERYLKAIEAYLTLVPSIISLEKYFAPSELNITYLPVDAAPPQTTDVKLLAKWVLEHYDYPRARFLMRQLTGDRRDGPYIVSASAPLSAPKPLSHHLWQDVSAVPAQLAGSWIKEFMNQAAQERFWETRSLPQLRLKIRAAIAVLSMALPDVQNSLDSYIKMRQPGSP